jgi:hypothetical protein
MDFDINNTIDAETLAQRWGVKRKTIDNKRYKGEGPNYYKIGGRVLYDLDDVKRIEKQSYTLVDGA